MPQLRRDIVTSAIAIVAFTVLFGVVYPLAVTGVSQVAFHGNANGQKVYVDGRLVGSKIIGQQFADPTIKAGKVVVDKNGNPVTTPDVRYFQTRPSATLPPDNAASSTFSNYGPSSTITRDALIANVKAYIALEQPYYPHKLTPGEIPVDAVDTSASGLDPQISLANARIQAYRIAVVRRLAMSEVRGLIDEYTSGRGLGFSGEAGVNVLELNLALDRLSKGH